MISPQAKISGPGKDTRKLLYVVDDEPMLLELATVILEPQGYALETFRDPAAALRSYASAQRQPDLLITDYAMHSFNGLELIASCRRIRPRQKALLVSGTVDETVYANSAVKPDLFLAKPYQARQLSELVRTLVGD